MLRYIYVLDSDLYRGHRSSLGYIKGRDCDHPLPILNFEETTRDLSFPGVSIFWWKYYTYRSLLTFPREYLCFYTSTQLASRLTHGSRVHPHGL